jgi:hypothetical protein
MKFRNPENAKSQTPYWKSFLPQEKLLSYTAKQSEQDNLSRIAGTSDRSISWFGQNRTTMTGKTEEMTARTIRPSIPLSLPLCDKVG